MGGSNAEESRGAPRSDGDWTAACQRGLDGGSDCGTGTLAVERALLESDRLAAALATGLYCCARHALLAIGTGDAGP